MVKESGEEEGAKEEKRWWKEREGGVEEQMQAVPNTMKIVLKARKGFVKIAIRNGLESIYKYLKNMPLFFFVFVLLVHRWFLSFHLERMSCFL